MKTTIPSGNYIQRSLGRSALLSVSLLVVCFAFLPNAGAVNPPPDGGYPGFNTAEGQKALFNLTTGVANSAVGWYSLFSNTDGSYNTALGAGTLLFNVGNQITDEGVENTGIGTAALLFNTTGSRNTAVGVSALLNNDIGILNTAVGVNALPNNTTGNYNTAIGGFALFFNNANDNTAIGASALSANSTGDDNTAIGFGALADNVDGDENAAVGHNALANNTSGNNNVALGFLAGNQQTTGSDNVYIGFNMQGTAGESNACYIASVFGQTSAGGIPVLINANHKLGTTMSSKRFKQEIRPMNETSEALFSLKPVTFRYRKEIDPAGTSQLGLVAEDVEKVNSDLVVRDKEGKPYSVRYDQVNAMLLNEFLKEHRHVQEQDATIARLEKQVEALTAGLRKVNAQLELSMSAPQTVFNDR